MSDVEPSPPAKRIEVGSRSRYCWSVAEKSRIVAESFERGVRPCNVARRHGITAAQLSYWRRQARSGAITVPEAGDIAFAEVRIETTQQDRAAPARDGTGLELGIGGTSVRVTTATDFELLARVVRLLRDQDV